MVLLLSVAKDSRESCARALRACGFPDREVVDEWRSLLVLMMCFSLVLRALDWNVAFGGVTVNVVT
jgi:hypothetical protein